MARELTSAEIEALAGRKGARRIAVENFLGTLNLKIGAYGNRCNLYQDAAAYRWNAATQNAIARGIERAFAIRGRKFA